MKVKLLLLLFIMAYADLAFAQAPATQFMLRKTFESADSKIEPAAFLATFPTAKQNSTLIDGGIGLSQRFIPNKFYGRLTYEFHKNTLISKEQNNSQGGLGIEFWLKRSAAPANFIVNSDFKYVKDVIASKESTLWTGELAPFSNVFNSPIYSKRNKCRWILSPSIGFEHQNTFDAKESKKDSLLGAVTRGVAKAKVSFSLLTDSPPEGGAGNPYLTAYVDGALRYDISNHTQTPNGSHPYLDVSVLYFPYPSINNKISVGVSYLDVDNPAKGLEHQQYWLLSFRIQIDPKK